MEERKEGGREHEGKHVNPTLQMIYLPGGAEISEVGVFVE